MVFLIQTDIINCYIHNSQRWLQFESMPCMYVLFTTQLTSFKCHNCGSVDIVAMDFLPHQLRDEDLPEFQKLIRCFSLFLGFLSHSLLEAVVGNR